MDLKNIIDVEKYRIQKSVCEALEHPPILPIRVVDRFA